MYMLTRTPVPTTSGFDLSSDPSQSREPESNKVIKHDNPKTSRTNSGNPKKNFVGLSSLKRCVLI